MSSATASAPPPEPVEALLAVQRARIELAREGAHEPLVRGARILAEPLEMDSERVGRLREQVPEADLQLSRRQPDPAGPRRGGAGRRADRGAGRLTEAVAPRADPRPRPAGERDARPAAARATGRFPPR